MGFYFKLVLNFYINLWKKKNYQHFRLFNILLILENMLLYNIIYNSLLLPDKKQYRPFFISASWLQPSFGSVLGGNNSSPSSVMNTFIRPPVHDLRSFCSFSEFPYTDEPSKYELAWFNCSLGPYKN